MKKAVLILITLFATMSNAQEQKNIPQISVSGEGKIKVKPDQVVLSLSLIHI